MPAIKRVCRRPSRRIRERGSAAVEFALVAIIFFTIVFGVMEMARAMYICNTLQEVTRRAAALAVNTDFTSTTALQRVREQAVFRDDPGLLMLADPISDRHVRIDYMSIPATGTVPQPIADAALPDSPAENLVTCMRNAGDPQCVRLVRVRICDPEGGAECRPVPYQTLVSLITLPFDLPQSTTIATVETLGRPPGLPGPSIPCAC